VLSAQLPVDTAPLHAGEAPEQEVLIVRVWTSAPQVLALSQRVSVLVEQTKLLGR